MSRFSSTTRLPLLAQPQPAASIAMSTRSTSPVTTTMSRREEGQPGVSPRRVGASESLFTPLASALGLRLLTPPSFLNAVAEGSDPTAADKATVDRQIATKAISLFVFNRQNSTPDVERLVGAANAAGIPVATITETLTPQGGTFQDWQTRQLHAIAASLAAAGARASAK